MSSVYKIITDKKGVKVFIIINTVLLLSEGNVDHNGMFHLKISSK
jgi:hypothetical protein